VFRIKNMEGVEGTPFDGRHMVEYVHAMLEE
jgi:hypothetical protein